MNGVIQVILVVLLLQSCSPKDPHLEKVLKISGNNRIELEKLLRYYSSPDDSLKYKAAVFLIKNMPYQSCISSHQVNAYDSVFDSIMIRDRSLLLTHDSLTNRAIRRENFEKIWKSYFPDHAGEIHFEFETNRDIEELSAEHLIENIEYAFKAWDNPWSKGYTFDQFCKYILPYRIGTEPSDAWRPYLYEQLKWVQDSLKHTDNPVKVSEFINKWVQNIVFDERTKQLSPGGTKIINLFKGKVLSSCYDQTALGIAILRSLGIAAAAATIPRWGIRSGSHEFNAVMDTVGRWHYFSTGYLNPEEFYLDSHAPKVYLTKFFAGQDSIDIKSYQQLTSRDITDDLLSVVDIEIKGADSLRGAEVYLCVFDNRNWVPLCKGLKVGNKIRFKKMARKMAYLPAIYKNDEFLPVGVPMIADEHGTVTYIRPREKKISHSFKRKFPILFPRVYDPRCMDLIGGRFQIADNINFQNAQDLFIIKDKPDLQVKTVKTRPLRGKYIRYVFPPVDHAFKSGPSLISFYDADLKKIEGKHISSKGVTEENMKQVFDEDLLSFVTCVQYESAINFQRPDVIVNKASRDSLWIGIALDENVSVSGIKYCARNDKNGIYAGMRYELFYWHNSDWVSLGIRQATGTNVSFNNIPTGALLWLRNLEEGEDERIFVIDNGKVIWL